MVFRAGLTVYFKVMKCKWGRVGDSWRTCELCYLQVLQDIQSQHDAVTRAYYNPEDNTFSITLYLERYRQFVSWLIHKGNLWLILENNITEAFFQRTRLVICFFFNFQGTVTDSDLTQELTNLPLQLLTHTP